MYVQKNYQYVYVKNQRIYCFGKTRCRLTADGYIAAAAPPPPLPALSDRTTKVTIQRSRRRTATITGIWSRTAVTI